MKFNWKFIPVLLLGATLTFAACSKDDDDMDPPMEETLYDRLGGDEMVADPANTGMMIEQGRLNLRSVVDSTIFVIAATPSLEIYFAPLLAEVGAGNLSNIAVLSRDLTDFFSVASGSENATYSGLSMEAAHDPARNPRMGAKSDDQGFDDFIAAVVTGAQQNNVPNELIGEVGALIETLRDVIVQR